MAGQVKSMIDKLIAKKSDGDRFIENSIRVKLILRGIDVDSFTEDSVDSQEDIAMVRDAAREFGVDL